MKKLYDELSHFVDDIAQNRELFAENYDLALTALRNKVDTSSKICQLIDFEKFAQVYFNPVAVNYFGVSNEELQRLGFQHMFRYLHPENFNIITTHISYFSSPENYDKPLSHIYYVRSKEGWRWLYNCTRVATFTAEGKAKYLMTNGMDISLHLEGRHKFSKLRKDIAFVEERKKVFDQLTIREREIMRLIVEEKNSIEIAALLNISSTTVDTHRNNIIKKLGVRSSVGLVKYALMFDVL